MSSTSGQNETITKLGCRSKDTTMTKTTVLQTVALFRLTNNPATPAETSLWITTEKQSLSLMLQKRKGCALRA